MSQSKGEIVGDDSAVQDGVAASGGHTPGPWVMEEGGGGHSARVSSESNPAIGTPRGYGRTIVLVGPASSHRPSSHDEHVANARLIAAAPDLLAALEVLYAYIAEEAGSDDETFSDEESIGWQGKGDGPIDDEIPLTFGAIRRARAAIANARGQTNYAPPPAQPKVRP